MRFSSLAAAAVAVSCTLPACDSSQRQRFSATPTAAADPGAPVLRTGTDVALAAVAPAVVGKAEPDSPCPAGMVLVEGSYCPKVRHRCLDYMDPEGPYEFYRCVEYVKPAQCLSPTRVHKRFCIDRDEYTPPGKSLPANFKSWTDADRTCRSLGKRVCLESEWNFACEGEELRPYPYGWKRDTTACNADHTDIVTPEGTLRDMRAPSDAYPRCASPFGVRNLSGNLEEFVTIDGSTPPRPAMKGAYWQPSRNHCRAAQTAHDRYYNGTETGFRCCSDPVTDEAKQARSRSAAPSR